ncbi:MAG: hypothetical protein HY735_34105 [Verrucomicrobia bacterium]|nr:hypothetical protein [Verrucomicrobiota bacterium]
MTNYVELPYNKKLNLLRAHDGDWPDLNHEKWCLHCGMKFNGHSVRVWKDDQNRLWLECGTPDCDGSPIDWADYPWWDEKHRRPKKRRKRAKGSSDGTNSTDASDLPF